MSYVDGYVLPVPKNKLVTYRRMAQTAAKVWRKCGALEYRECVGDDLKAHPGMGTTFLRTTRVKRGEAVVFAWVVFKSRADRDRVNAKVMKDPRILKMMKQPPPFDAKRMAYGGFKTLVKA